MKHILIIDDSLPIGELMSDILEMQSYQVTIRGTGIDAVTFIEKLHPDLLLLDVMLDLGIDGREICRALKQREDLMKELSVIMVSATHNLKDTLLDFCVPNDFVSKPFDMDHLVQTVGNQFPKGSQAA